jgi:hypothetical protein
MISVFKSFLLKTTNIGDNGYKLIVLCLCTLLIVYFSLAQPLGVPRDYLPYIASFDSSRAAGWSHVLPSQYSWEPGFMVVSFLLAKAIPDNVYVFLCIVLLASAFKLALLYGVSSSLGYSLAMVLFFFKFFPLQDFNQLRGALAIGFLMLVYYQWTMRGNLWLGVVFSTCAILFHYLSAAVLPFLFLANNQLVLRRLYVFGFGLLLLGLIAASQYFALPLAAESIPRLINYVGSTAKPAVSSYLSPVFYPEFFLLAVSAFLWKDCTGNMKRVFSLQIIGFAIFYGFFEFGAIGMRIREAFSVFWLFYVADYSKVTTHLKAAILIFVLMNIALGSYLFYFSDFLKH